MRRIVSLWFPDYAVERFIRGRMKARKAPPPAKLPFALVETGAKGLRLAAVNATARAFGLRRGQRLADARAAVPDLLSEPHEPEADMASLLGLCRWLERYSPWVAPDAPDGVLLDVTGIPHLFGGEAAMLAEMGARLTRYGFTARLSIAATIGAAWALARYSSDPLPLAGEEGDPLRSNGEGEGARGTSPHLSHRASARRAPVLSRARERTILEALPIEALRIDSESARTLRRLGLKTIGSLLDIPRASLARRFRGETIPENVPMRLDEALGHRDEPLNPLNPPSSFMAHRALMEPVVTPEGLEAVLAGLVAALARDLEAKAQGARRLILKLFRSDGSRIAVPVGLSAPSHDPRHILRLLKPKLESIDAGFGIDAMTLEAREMGPIGLRQYGFMEDAGGEGLDRLNDRVMNRHEAVIASLREVESHIPERAEIPHFRHPGERKTKEETAVKSRTRPLLIFDRPEPVSVIAAVPDGPPMRFTWRRVTRRVAKAQGPERIAPEWWRPGEGGRLRDYYAIEDERGRRYWLYREGLYGETQPRWFVHGLSP
ncbi:MAG: Y-family DNA polymerase [Hyphomicrobiales bacterium]